MKTSGWTVTGLTVAAMGVLAGCSSGLPTQSTGGGDRVLRNNYDQTTGSFIGDTPGALFSFGRGSAQPDQGGLAVNAYLWRGTLETLKFMPLASADPFGGVIITDWWTPATSTNERFKATAYVLGKQLRADGVRISLFRQVQQNGQWVDAPVDPAKPTELENMVLARARDLRAQEGAQP